MILDHLTQWLRGESAFPSRGIDMDDAGIIGVGKGNSCRCFIECIDSPAPDEERILSIEGSDDGSIGWTEFKSVAFNPSQGPLSFHLPTPTPAFTRLNIDAGSPITCEAGIILESEQTNL